jgi:hypothetical protein
VVVASVVAGAFVVASAVVGNRVVVVVVVVASVVVAAVVVAVVYSAAGPMDEGLLAVLLLQGPEETRTAPKEISPCTPPISARKPNCNTHMSEVRGERSKVRQTIYL